MSKHAGLSPRSERLLMGFIGEQIADIIGMKCEGRQNDETGRFGIREVGLVSESGKKVMISVLAFDLAPQLEGFLMEVTQDFEIREWPGGPLSEWESVAENIPGFLVSRVESISAVSSLYDRESYKDYADVLLDDISVDEALIISFETGKTLILAASLVVPTVIEVFSATPEECREWAKGKKVRLLQESS